MAVRQYSLRKDGNTRLSENFLVREFASRDGSDKILIEEALVSLLQQLRDHFQTPIIINSGFRTPAHNRAVGGSAASLHLRGAAADIVVRGVAPLEVARRAEQMNIGGIGLYQGFVHVDTRFNSVRWDNRGTQMLLVAGFGGSFYNTTPAAVGAASTAVDISAEPAVAIDAANLVAERMFTVNGEKLPFG